MTDSRKETAEAAIAAPSWGDLYSIAFKIRGMGYLIENQRVEPSLPLDPDVVAQGIGQILGELGETLFEAVSHLESATLDEINHLKSAGRVRSKRDSA